MFPWSGPFASRLLRDKYLWSFSVPWLVIIIALLLIFPAKQKSDILDATTREVRTLSTMLAMTAGEGLEEGSLGLVKSAFAWTRRDSNVVYVAILDERDSTIVEYNPTGRVVNKKQVLTHLGVSSDADVVVAAAPIRGTTGVSSLGSIILVYSLDRANARIRQEQFVAVLATLVLFAVGLRGVLLLKEQSRALKAEADKYRVTFENTGTATVIIEEDTTISLANAGFETLSRYSKLEIEGKKRWTEFVHPLDLEVMLSRHHQRRAESADVATHYEFRFLDRGGDIHDIDLSIEMIPGTRRSIASLMDITERKRAEEVVLDSLHEKETLLKEIHHRVKNNMQIISSLLSIQSAEISDPSMKELFKESQGRVKSMALVHEKLYGSDRLSRIPFHEYLQQIVRDLEHHWSKPGVSLTVHAEPIFLGIEQALPCGLIVNELVTNALKHGFPNGGPGLVNVSLDARSDCQFTLAVSDNGIGFPSGKDFKTIHSMGMRLIRDLTSQLDGTIDLTTDGSTCFTVAIPLLPESTGTPPDSGS